MLHNRWQHLVLGAALGFALPATALAQDTPAPAEVVEHAVEGRLLGLDAAPWAERTVWLISPTQDAEAPQSLQSSVTDAEGRFAFADLTEGRHVLVVGSQRYQLDLPREDEGTINLLLPREVVDREPVVPVGDTFLDLSQPGAETGLTETVGASAIIAGAGIGAGALGAGAGTIISVDRHAGQNRNAEVVGSASP